MNQQMMILLTKEEIEIISKALDDSYWISVSYLKNNKEIETLKKSIQDLQFKLSEL